ncbi:7318_t:CDS:2 [Funneliformis caledonium]|uniref:7318_t:CDS:1 n=1 Tax=Funneliformis caledonium TaxID=1117310 RepID=A0A9N8Z2W3_9GLOM|nr:7318_t:CDS:2 [Funneliformis caledonium]
MGITSNCMLNVLWASSGAIEFTCLLEIFDVVNHYLTKISKFETLHNPP